MEVFNLSKLTLRERSIQNNEKDNKTSLYEHHINVLEAEVVRLKQNISQLESAPVDK